MYTKQLLYFVTLFVFIVSCNLSIVAPDLRYGEMASYGTHIGLDYSLSIGTPIIACADGEVMSISETGNAYYEGGIGIRILHRSDNEDESGIVSIYHHLHKPMVSLFERVKRGQLIGLSGKSNNGYQHLHFQLDKPGVLSGRKMKYTYNPRRFAIGGSLQCFDPKRDYSIYSEIEITLPIACGDYRKELISKIKSQ